LFSCCDDVEQVAGGVSVDGGGEEVVEDEEVNVVELGEELEALGVCRLEDC